ncbi:MAG: DMT family transporter [Clostridia bacterium]|nr:DMT family transporter [Clostridia bacterium]
MKNKQFRANCMLLGAAFIWGMAFVAQSEGLSLVGPFTLNGIRCIIGGLVLLPVVRFLDKRQPGKQGPWPIGAGICCGVVLFWATMVQQLGLMRSTAGKAGFITALYIIMVPLLGVFFKKRVGLSVWISVLLATVGMYLLCMRDGFQMQIGDIYLLLCAVCFAMHILVIDHFAPRVDCIRMSCLQFFVCGILSLIGMVFNEKPQLSQIWQAALPILYIGIFSCAVAYTLQIVAQRDTSPAMAALLCSLESVFAFIGGVIFLQERFSLRELFGCIIMFAAILLAQFPILKDRKVDEHV